MSARVDESEYRMNMRRALCIGFGLLAASAFAQPQYEVVDLTNQFGEELTAVDINNNGVVVGHMRLSSTEYQACIIQNGELTMLPMYNGVHDWYPTDINDNGDVLGAGQIGQPYGYSTLLYRNGKLIDTGIQGSVNFPGALAMNNLAQIAGGANGTPFIWENGKTTAIPGVGAPWGINDSQTIVGSTGVGVELEARMWSGGVYSSLHPAWARRSESVNVNELDESAGYAYRLSGGQRGVLWRNGKAIDLGDFGGGQSRAYDVNDLSQVVGWGTNTLGIDEGLLWDNGLLYRLTEHIGEHPGFLWLEAAIAINNHGQILTSAAGGAQLGHELLLNPVPEVTTLTPIALGLLLLTISRRRGRRG